eukprot:TRINITY_DN10713_c0_g1_i2.p1 TRINITY_DN10713_c0_g1~~TRINITY_DN10713_c0_g1_i2.p1  ORF type:complete len:668 (-),score=135.37 TRINITY_DN10713_c0_g1_i2:11-2014(-)
MSSYVPIEIRQTSSIARGIFPEMETWRINLVEFSPDGTKFFIANSDGLLAYAVEGSTMVPEVTNHIKLSQNASRINQIKTGHLGNIPVLVTVDGEGDVHVYDLRDLEKPPVKLRNHGSSTWGIALHQKTVQLAVSANSFNITVWSLPREYGQENSDSIENEMLSLETGFSEANTCLIEAHDHNIPCIDFSPCGRYLGSCSIDQRFRLWDLQSSPPQLVKSSYRGSHWCWGLLLIERDDIIQLPKYDPIWEQIPAIQEHFHYVSSTYTNGTQLVSYHTPYANRANIESPQQEAAVLSDDDYYSISEDVPHDHFIEFDSDSNDEQSSDEQEGGEGEGEGEHALEEVFESPESLQQITLPHEIIEHELYEHDMENESVEHQNSEHEYIAESSLESSPMSPVSAAVVAEYYETELESEVLELYEEFLYGPIEYYSDNAPSPQTPRPPNKIQRIDPPQSMKGNISLNLSRKERLRAFMKTDDEHAHPQTSEDMIDKLPTENFHTTDSIWRTKADPTVPEPRESILEDMCILGFDKETLRLFDHHFSTYYESGKLINKSPPVIAYEMVALDRLFHVRFVPELSLILCASQSTGYVLLCRLITDDRTTLKKVSLLPEAMLPQRERPGIMAGFTLNRIDMQGASPSTAIFSLSIIYMHGVVSTYLLKGQRTKPSV